MTSIGFGTITPSSNVVVERVTIAMTRDLPEVSPHFARFGYSGSADPSPDDYDWVAMLGAAGLLADAKPQVICWNGSKGGMIGFDRDRLLCERITERYDIPAVTSTLALEEVLRREGIKRVGFVTPYAEAANRRVVSAWTAGGFSCLPIIAAGLTDNYSYSTLPGDRLRMMAYEAAEQRPEVIIFYCTNMNGAELCADLESELNLPVLDSVSIGVWKSLAILKRRLPDNGWGHLLS